MLSSYVYKHYEIRWISFSQTKVTRLRCKLLERNKNKTKTKNPKTTKRQWTEEGNIYLNFQEAELHSGRILIKVLVLSSMGQAGLQVLKVFCP